MSWIAFRLYEMHNRLDEALRAERRRKVPDSFKITRLKKLKLAIKDRLAALARTPRRI